jgi:hypothetical protein
VSTRYIQWLRPARDAPWQFGGEYEAATFAHMLVLPGFADVLGEVWVEPSDLDIEGPPGIDLIQLVVFADRSEPPNVGWFFRRPPPVGMVAVTSNA